MADRGDIINLGMHGAIEVMSVEVPCAFCAGSYQVAGQAGTGTVDCLIHTMPLCDSYLSLEPDEYLYQCRMVRQSKANKA